jgi:hypothetical protein
VYYDLLTNKGTIMTLKQLKKITHDHKVSLAILVSSGVLDLSFCVEKILIYCKINVSPLTWAIVFGSLGLISLFGAFIELKSDISTDCSDK